MYDARPKALIAGNWKMNGLRGSAAELSRLVAGVGPDLPVEVVVCPPATLLADFAGRLGGSAVRLGGQDCHPEPSGAHTGDLSAEMLADAGARAVIVGHSERRADHGESDALVRAKAAAALRAGLTAIICVGETEGERLQGRALDVVRGQLAGSLPEGAAPGTVVVAYEPVWAIGTGRTAETGDIAEMHGAIRTALVERLGPDEGRAVRILYGGSVKPGNAAEILRVADVNGALVGGASLKADDFLAILRAAP